MTRLRLFGSWVLRRKSSESTPAVSPVTIVSIRAAEIYLAEQDPKVGNRLVIQALVKFDTTQVGLRSIIVAALASDQCGPPGTGAESDRSTWQSCRVRAFETASGRPVYYIGENWMV